MKKLILLVLFLLVLVGGLTLGPAMQDYNGYVLIVMEQGTLQMSIPGLVAGLFVLGAALWLIWWLLRTLYRLVSGSQNWLWSWSARKRRKAFTYGLLALAEGDYPVAKKHLDKIKFEDFDGLNQLAAAEAELNLGNQDKARELWQLAAEYAPATGAAQLSLIRHHLQHQESDAALAILNELDEKQKSNPRFIRLWAEALAQAGKWQLLREKLPVWKKPLGDDYPNWAQQASKGQFAEIASKEGANQLKSSWQSMPRATRKDPAQQAAYVQQLIDQGVHTDAEEALVSYQKSAPQPLLLPLFRQLVMPNPAKAIKLLESWLKKDEDNVDLLSTLGQLVYNANDLSLAEKVLSKAIKLESRQEDVLLMARIKEALQDQQGALALYKQSAIQG